MSSCLLLSLENIDVVGGKGFLLKDISLTVEEGKLITLVGPNGAGKTTLLKVLLNLLCPTRGQVERRKDLRVGYIPQKFTASPLLPLSVEFFLNLTPSPHLSAYEGLTQVGALSLLEKSVQHLSGGELQKVLFAKALMQAPNLLVLDEPTQGLDLDSQGFFYALLEELREKNPKLSIVLASHDLYVVLRTSDLVVCLNQHICCMGHPEAVQKDPHYKRLFGDRLALVPYTHVHTHTH